MESRDRELFELLEPIVAGQGADLVEVGLTRTGRGSVIRIVIYSPAGVSHADCVRVTRAAEHSLESGRAVVGSYTLEVSSPGLKRVLKQEREFEIFRGQPVRVWVEDGDSSREITGISEGIRRSEGVVVHTEDGSESVIPWSRVTKARLDSKASAARGLGGKGR